MRVELQEVKGRNTSEERIILKVNEDCLLNFYFIFNTKKLPNDKISKSVKHPFWLPKKEVKKGDLVVIYSKIGTSSFKVNDDKTSSYFYYRNFESPILIDDEIVLVVELNTWRAETF